MLCCFQKQGTGDTSIHGARTESLVRLCLPRHEARAFMLSFKRACSQLGVLYGEVMTLCFRRIACTSCLALAAFGGVVLLSVLPDVVVSALNQ